MTGEAGEPGDAFGPYRIEGLLGRGGMGEVHRAVDTRRGRVVALKRLPAALADDPGFQARFRAEAELTAGLREPHIVPIHDHGEIDGRPFLDMRLIEGSDLQSLVDGAGALPPARAVAIVEQVGAALDAAHAAGLVHRDVKPSNVLVDDDGVAHLIDFGLARAAAAARVTTTGAAMGTLAAMAPERFAGDDDGDHRVDVYALGCLLFEALTGGRPFGARSAAKLVHAHLYADPPRVSDVDDDLAAFDGVVARALAKDPDRRYGSAGDLAAAARAALAGEPVVLPAVDGPTIDGPAVDGPAVDGPAVDTPGGGPVDSPTSRGPVDSPTSRGASSGRGGLVGTLLVVAATVLLVLAIPVIALIVEALGDLPSGGPTPVRPLPADTTAVVPGVGEPMALSPDGTRLYAAGDGLGVVDTATNTVVASVPGVPAAESIAVSPDGRRAVVPARVGDTAAVVDLARRTVATVPVGPVSSGVVISGDGRRGYVARRGGVDVLDLDAATRVGTLDVPVAASRAFDESGRGQALVLSPDDRFLWVAGGGVEPVSVVDTRSGAVVARVAVFDAVRLVITPDGSRVLALSRTNGTDVLDTATRRSVRHDPAVARVLGAGLGDDGRRLYLVDGATGTIAVVDTATGGLQRRLDAGEQPSEVIAAPDGRHAYADSYYGLVVLRTPPG